MSTKTTAACQQFPRVLFGGSDAEAKS